MQIYDYFLYPLIISLTLYSPQISNTVSEHYNEILWQPPIKTIKFLGKDQNQFRLTYDYDSKEEVIVRNVQKGKNDIAQYKSDEKLNISEATISFNIKFEQEFIFPQRDHKLPLGLWGGTAGSYCISGGCHPQHQDGFSVRLIESAGKPFLYIYSLNREEQINNEKIYGQLIGSNHQYTMATGEWLKIELRVKLNGNNQENDEAELMINSKQIIKTNNIKLRTNPNWLIRGPILTDMFGGTVTSLSNQSAKDQKIWYKNYVIKGKKHG